MGSAGTFRLMTVRELREKYLAFFAEHGHAAHPSGSLIPYDVTGKLDDSLLFNAAGMVQFKPYFRGIAQPPHPRLTTVQKCVRTGDIEEVGDASHLTFFEMLGNFSFGDYFKAEAIQMSWEFLISDKWLGLDPRRLSFTVYHDDDEAYAAWAACLQGAGLDAEHQIFRLGEDTNYWPANAPSQGPPGPCGPNTEMFYWTDPDSLPPQPYSLEQYLADEAAGKWVEIWNDVFIQFEWQGELRDPKRPDLGYAKTGMPDLPLRGVDTGMGLERTAMVLGGYPTVFETDAFAPILRHIETLTGHRYDGGAEIQRAFRILADHARTATFCVSDGVLPSNTGRGYVLRRLIRRAALQAVRKLNVEEPILAELAETIIELFESAYPELSARRAIITETLRNEENLFRRTLTQGSELLNQALGQLNGKVLDGETAFQLYDTFGFPLEVTREVAAEQGIAVDEDGYRAALEEAQARSRAAGGMGSVYGSVSLRFDFSVGGNKEAPTPTEFVGYENTQAESRIVGALPVFEDGKATGEFVVALDRTPCYAESGGQVSDRGLIESAKFNLQVVDLIKQQGIYVHLCEPIRIDGLEGLDALDRETAERKTLDFFFNQTAHVSVDPVRRKSTERHHTATHLLHAALRYHLGEHVTQAGSLVSPEHLRFDFTHGQAMTSDQIKRVEDWVNDLVLAALPVRIFADVPLEQAREMGAMALFGEKYADFVRVVQIGDMPPFEESPSRELCGGTHVGNTGEIGLVKVLSEGSAASGVRRIEAIAGDVTNRWLRDQLNLLQDAAAMLKTSPRELGDAIHKLQAQVKEERRKRERLAAQGTAQTAKITSIGPVELHVLHLTDADPKEAQAAADRLTDPAPNRVGVVILEAEGKLLMVCKVGGEAKASGAHAGNLVKAMAQAAGGGGGGRPDFATAGARDVTQKATLGGVALKVLAEQVGA